MKNIIVEYNMVKLFIIKHSTGKNTIMMYSSVNFTFVNYTHCKLQTADSELGEITIISSFCLQ